MNKYIYYIITIFIMASIAFGYLMSPDIINIINNDIFDISISNKKRYFKNIHNHLHYIFIHAIHWLDDYPKNSISTYKIVLTMLRSRYGKNPTITNTCKNGTCRCFPRRRNNFATIRE